MREFIRIVEHAVGQTITLLDLYSEHELTDEREFISHHVDEDHWRTPLVVHQMTWQQAKSFLTPKRDTTVWQAFRDFAGANQKALVRDKMNSYDHERVIVVRGDVVLDGNHHLIAGIKAKQPIRYVDLAELL